MHIDRQLTIGMMMMLIDDHNIAFALFSILQYIIYNNIYNVMFACSLLLFILFIKKNEWKNRKKRFYNSNI